MSARLRGNPGRLVPALLIGAGLVLHAMHAAGAETGGPADSAAVPRHSVRDSPGWYPLVDPESSSVALGRRANAPVVSRPFQGGTRSLDELGRVVCRLLHRNDRDSLMSLCIREEEFRDILWREFPQSRPATGLEWEDGWRVLFARLYSGTTDAVNDHGGRYYQFLRFERSDTTARYRNFKLHNGLVLVVRNDLGETERWGWLRSVAERKGAFKIYSVRD